MFVDGVDTVIATDIEEKNGYYGISNMIVHENYKIDGISDMHDIGELMRNLFDTPKSSRYPIPVREYLMRKRPNIAGH